MWTQPTSGSYKGNVSTFVSTFLQNNRQLLENARYFVNNQSSVHICGHIYCQKVITGYLQNNGHFLVVARYFVKMWTQIWTHFLYNSQKYFVSTFEQNVDTNP